MKEVAEKRQKEHCNECNFNSNVAKRKGLYSSVRPDEYCIVCGCNIDLKTHDMAQECPKGFWKAELSVEDAEKVEEIINKNDDSEKEELL